MTENITTDYGLTDCLREIETLKLALTRSAARIAETERAFNQAEADTACAVESLRELNATTRKKILLFISIKRNDNREALHERMEKLKAANRERRRELETACLEHAALREKLNKAETAVKRLRQKENRLFDYSEC